MTRTPPPTNRDRHDRAAECERCGAVGEVDEGLCRRCREAPGGKARAAGEPSRVGPHQAPVRQPRQPPWRRRGA